MHKEKIEIARELIGKALKQVREAKRISKYSITKNWGLSIRQINAIEAGTTAYTVDSLLLYCGAVNCYFYLEDRDGDEHLSTLDRDRKMAGLPPDTPSEN